jgi:predicted transcriptional regulator of viral defense system
MESAGSIAPVYPSKTTQGVNRAVAALADRQHEVISLDQLRALGLAPSTVRDRAAAWRLHRVHWGVYAVVAPAKLDARGRRMAAVLACGPGAVLSHRTAADAWGIMPRAGARIEVSVPTRNRRRRPGISVHRSPGLRDSDVTTVENIPCTTPARTLLDLAAVVSVPTLANAIEAAERLRIFDLRQVEEQLERARGTPAAKGLRAALAKADSDPPPTRRELERLAYEVFSNSPLGRPLVNSAVATAEETLEVDFCWPDRRLIAEADSWDFHGTRAAFERDRRRDQLLTAAGWTVVRFTWRQLRDAPHLVLAACTRQSAPSLR